MKKLISCLLAVLLVCSLMSMNVFADTVDVVGTPTNTTPSINDGKDDFTSSNGNGANADINVNFGQTTTKPGEDTDGDGEPDEDDVVIGGESGNIIIHKYAVDITYGEFLLDLNDFELDDEAELPTDVDVNGNGAADDTITGPFYMVWDVNNYKYVLCGKDATTGEYIPVDIESAPDKDEVVVDEETGATAPNGNGTADILETGITLDSTVMVTNHSDLSVFTKLVLTNDRTDIKWEITAAKNNGTKTANVSDLTATEEITKATAATDTATGEATNGSTYSFTATPNVEGEGWLGVVGNLLNNPKTTIGTITVTIAKDTASFPTANA